MSTAIHSGSALNGKFNLKRIITILLICFAVMTITSVLIGSLIYLGHPGAAAAIGIIVPGISLGTGLGFVISKWVIR